MKALKILGIVAAVYVAIVVVFESLLGAFQPDQPGQTIVITTFEEDGTAHDRVVTRLVSQGDLYVAANHWPRAWYHRALANPRLVAVVDGERGEYVAVPVTDSEHQRIDREHALPFVFRVLTGFPPRYFVRLEPADETATPS